MLNDHYKRSLSDALQSAGVSRGDILYVSSDIKTLTYNLGENFNITSKQERDAAFHEIVDVFQDTVGEGGTLLFPVFSWDYCRGKGFDIRNTKGEVGALSNWILKNRDDFRRTRHPIYSFMAWGKDSGYLCSLDNQDAWGHMSPFHYFRTAGAKQLLFNIEAYQGMTFGHYVEQEAGVPYRHPKYFFGKYIDWDGMEETRMYSMYVRDMEVEVECNIHNSFLIGNGVAKQAGWDGNVLTVVNLKDSYPVLKDDIENNNGTNTLKFRTGALDWGKGKSVPYEVKGISLK